jgi:hypothetical protein
MFTDKINKRIRTEGADSIDFYIKDGFEKVCDVEYTNPCYEHKYEWLYTNVNTSLMFSKHCSWIYFIVLGRKIKKIGETGNPLGIGFANDPYHVIHTNPITGTKSRLGRLRAHGDHDGDTDYNIRMSLFDSDEQISIWAKKCATTHLAESIGGKETLIEQTTHKAQELEYLRQFYCMTGHLPELNKGNK